MKVLVLGASGATGRQVVTLLLNSNAQVVVMVRSRTDFEAISPAFTQSTSLTVIEAHIAQTSVEDLSSYLCGCDAVVSCLGHNLTFKGLFGQPRKLVADALRKVVDAIERDSRVSKIKIILMNTSGNANRDIPEKPPLSQRFVVSLLRLLLPPHSDNEQAADLLRVHVGQAHQQIEWVAVRPDALTNEDNVSPYDAYESPVRNVIFNAGKTSRINVAAFMLELLTDAAVWAKWAGRMPVLYNRV